MADLDLVIKNARVRRSSGLAHIGVRNGKVVSIDSAELGPAKQVIDANGCLVLPALVDPHMHLDKAYLGGWAAPTSGLYGNAEGMIREQKKKMTVEEVRRRAVIATEQAVKNGVGYIRTNVDVDTICGLTALEGVLKARQDCADLVDIQIVALAQADLLEGGGERLILKAMEMGADVVGGSPRQEMDDADMHRHIDKVFEIAKRFNRPIDMHVDATCDPNLRGIHYLAAKTIREGYEGRVAAGHVVALTYYNDYYAERVINLIRRAGVHIVTCPATTMISAPALDKEPRGRGITRVKQLLGAGVNVAVGQDNIDDPYNPFGDADPFTNGFLTAYGAFMSSDDDIEALTDAITANGGKALGLAGIDLAVGGHANLCVVNAQTLREAFRRRSERLYVIRGGKVVATTKVESRLHRA